MTWNLNNFGSSKTTDEIEFIAKTIKSADIVAIQEIVTNPSGAKTLAALHLELTNSTGTKWDYAISPPTDSSPYRSERYAYLWKTSKVKLKNRPTLEQTYKDQIEREPYIATFEYKRKEFMIFNFHALPKKHQPEKEIKYFKFFPTQYTDQRLIFLGDFNTPQSHSVFNPLKKMTYQPVFTDQKTSLRQKCINNDCLASEYDNIFLSKKDFTIESQDTILFYEDFNDIKEARKISDHIPIAVRVTPN
ncbi:endonuclease/exonuclease/phosphatase family protein [Myroides albus]|nr:MULTISPECIES: endonuclease/exonuclease/phosphatase family protein [Myroides]UVD80851.1 endonuclease/exonuclease/phosphatase family protein [Myroides albus]